jgi:hypothetical protein
MVLGAPVPLVIEWLGHDGSEIIWPNLPDPGCRRGFHIQECIERLRRVGLTATPYEAIPCHAPSFDVPAFRVLFGGNEVAALERFTAVVGSTRGILTGQSKIGHATAYEYGVVFDPAGLIYNYSPEECQAHGFLSLCAWSIK